MNANEVAPVRPGEEFDVARLQHWLSRRREDLGLAEDDPAEPEVLQFPHGSANLTYLLRFGDQEFVLRRPPGGTPAPGAHDMRREFSVLSRLWRQYDRAPRAYLFCDDPDVLDRDFFVMQRRTGEVIRDEIPESMRHHADVGYRIGLAVVEALADLHTVDPSAAGLGDLGRPDGFVERQVSGWAKRWDLARPDDAPPEMDDIAARLADSVPAPQRVSILHNDPKLDNCQFDPADPDRVHTVFDWDMATLGDPLVDLGTLLGYSPDPADPPGQSRAQYDGMTSMGLPNRAVIVQRYTQRMAERGTQLDLDALGWYDAFAQWKLAVVLQQLYNRFASGDSRDERMADKADRVPDLARSAAATLGRR